MRILVTNDDGVLAPGLAALYRAVADMGDVTVVAPATPQSATGHSITVRGPLAIDRVEVGGQFWALSVEGRPADCVKLACRELFATPPDLVLSGINDGANVGINVLYSGTVGAAAEGALMGSFGVAMSLARLVEMDFDRAAKLCRSVLDSLLAGGPRPGQLVNVNIPELVKPNPRGVRIVRQSAAGIREKYNRNAEQDGGEFFSLDEFYSFNEDDADSDVVANRDGFITITPMQLDLTDRGRLEELERVEWGDSVEL